jgi:hypothetical protein
MGRHSQSELDLEKRMQDSGIFADMTHENFKEKIDLFLKSESKEQAEKDKKILEKVKIKAENKQLERELQRYDAYTTDTRVLTAVAKFMEAPMEHRDAALMEVIRVLNNAKNKYDKMKLTKKIKGAE